MIGVDLEQLGRGLGDRDALDELELVVHVDVAVDPGAGDDGLLRRRVDDQRRRRDVLLGDRPRCRPCRRPRPGSPPGAPATSSGGSGRWSGSSRARRCPWPMRPCGCASLVGLDGWSQTGSRKRSATSREPAPRPTGRLSVAEWYAANTDGGFTRTVSGCPPNGQRPRATWTERAGERRERSLARSVRPSRRVAFRRQGGAQGGTGGGAGDRSSQPAQRDRQGWVAQCHWTVPSRSTRVRRRRFAWDGVERRKVARTWPSRSTASRSSTCAPDRPARARRRADRLRGPPRGHPRYLDEVEAVQLDQRLLAGSAILVGSSGGHLAQLLSLAPLWAKDQRSYVTFDTTDARLAARRRAGHLGAPPDHPQRTQPAAQQRPGVPRGRAAAVPTWSCRPAPPSRSRSSSPPRLRGIPTVYVEVYDRIDSPTLTGRLCRPLATLFCVQWPEQLEFYEGSELVGSLM